MSEGAYVCINCGAKLVIEAKDGTLPATAACTFCGVVNDRAQLDLLRDRADARRAELVKTGRTRFTLQVVAIVTVCAVVIAGVAFTRTSGALATAWSEVDRAEAQVKNVHQRQLELQKQLAEAEPSESKNAQLEGAENRVRVERGKYQTAAAAYNAEVGTWWGRLVARVKGLPLDADPSGEAW
jgi:DNA-directed RNA polymerase subunit RPC12/RpoP